MLALGAQHPRLDHGVALPVAAVVLVIVLHGGKGDGERARIAEGAQPHIDPKYLTILGGLVEGIDQPLPQLDEEGLVGEFAPSADCVAVLGEGEDKIDIRGKIQLTAAELAHAEDQQRLRVAIPVHGGAQLVALPLVEPVAGGANQGIRQFGEMDKALFHRRVAQQLAPGDHQHAAAAELAQDALERLFITDLCKQCGQIALIGGPAFGPLEIPRGEDLRHQFGLLDERIGDKIGEAKQGQQGLANRIGQGAIIGRQLDQPLPLALGLILQQGRKRGGRRERRKMLGHGCRPCG